MELPEALRQLALLGARDQEVRGGLDALLSEAAGRKWPEHQSMAASELRKVPEWASMSVAALAEIRTLATTRQFDKILAALSPVARAFAEKHDLVNHLRHGGIAFLAPGSVWPTKMWTESSYLQCAQELSRQGYKVILFGAANEKTICQRIAAYVTDAVVLAGETSLYESTELLALGARLICNDSGAMHMAAAVDLPSVAVFGPTTLGLGYRPWQNHARAAQVELNCRPCGKHGAKKCPLGTHACMKQVTPEMVLELSRRK